MPRLKRGLAAGAEAAEENGAESTEPVSKKQRRPGNASQEAAAVTVEPKMTRGRAAVVETSETAETPPPTENGAVAEPKKKRGRAATARAAGTGPLTENGATPEPKKRGRPADRERRHVEASPAPSDEEPIAEGPKKKRGRSKTADPSPDVVTEAQSVDDGKKKRTGVGTTKPKAPRKKSSVRKQSEAVADDCTAENGLDHDGAHAPTVDAAVLKAYLLNKRPCVGATRCQDIRGEEGVGVCRCEVFCDPVGQKCLPMLAKCDSNPKCLKGLGQELLLDDSATSEERIEKVLFYDGYGPRGDNPFVGLKNLGSTCYAAGTLHILNHIPVFKERLFKWNPNEDPTEWPNFEENEDSSLLPRSPAGTFIYVLSLMMKSRRAFVDPEPLIRNFNIQTSEEQDTGEFLTLVLSMLESCLGRQSESMVKFLVQNLFRGSTKSTITCQNCKGESAGSPVNFYMLLLSLGADVKKKDLKELLHRFVAVESLTGDNKYACKNCKSKQDAEKQEKFVDLPPVLVLQFQRSVFLGAPKNMSPVAFSETLDMSSFVGPGPKSKTYSLLGVLAHTGTEADTGHYETYILHQPTHTWWKCNDEVVEKKDSPDFDDGGGKKRAGTYVSTGTYLLVYGEKGLLGSQDPMAVACPPWADKYVAADDAAYVEGRDEALKAEEEHEEERSKKVDAVRQFLKTELKGEHELVPTNVLSHYVGDDRGDAPNLDMDAFLCPHGRLVPEMSKDMKYVPVALADCIYEGKEDIVRFGKDMLCSDCVNYEKNRAARKKSVDQDAQIVRQLLQAETSPEDQASGFWVGKESSKTWKAMAIEDFGNTKEVGLFNADAACPHGGLVPDEKKRRLVSAVLWEMFRRYFPDCPEFPTFSEPCAQCVEEVRSREEAAKENVRRAAELKNTIGALVARQKPDVLHGPVLLLPDEFVKNVRSFLKNPSKVDLPSSVDYGSVLCDHVKIAVNFADEDRVFDTFFLAKLNELDAFKRAFEFPIVMTGAPPEIWDPENGSLVEWTFQPDVCVECAEFRHAEEEAAAFKYQSKLVYVHEIPLADDVYAALHEGSFDDAGMLITKKTPPQAVRVPQALVDAEDPDFNPAKKGKRISVSSTYTLEDLKNKIQEKTKVPVDEQLVLLGRRELRPDDETLESLRVPPGAHLFVGFRKNRLPGAGFGGTKLVLEDA